MRKRPAPADPVLRRIHELVPGEGTQIPTVITARRILRRVYEESGAIFNGQFAKAILELREAGLVVFDVEWNYERKRQDWNVRLTQNCRKALDRAKRRATRGSASTAPAAASGRASAESRPS